MKTLMTDITDNLFDMAVNEGIAQGVREVIDHADDVLEIAKRDDATLEQVVEELENLLECFAPYGSQLTTSSLRRKEEIQSILAKNGVQGYTQPTGRA